MTQGKEEAIKVKDEGNQYLKEHKFEEAIKSYTKAIELDPTNAVFYSNRAQVHIKMENYGLAIQDCDSALAVNPNFLKAYYRKGVAQMAILQHKKAQQNFQIILKRLPNDALTLENYKQCTNYLKRQAFEKAIAGEDQVSILNTIDYEGVQVEKSWEGPELKITATKVKDENKKENVVVNIEGLDQSYLKYMINLFKKGGKLPKKHVFAIISKVHEILKQEQTMTEVSINHSKLKTPENKDEIIGGSKLTVVGDTHGQFYDVLNLFKKFGYVSKDHVYLFNGDFVDRGSWSCEVALYLYVLKILYPHSIFINRGNHETSDMNKTYGFTDECEAKYSKKIFDAFTESFGALPLATLINREYLCMHGGLFSNDKVTLQDIKSLNRFPKNGSTQPPKEGLAMELLWTDPQEESGRSPSKRGIGMQFGPDITERFCLSNKVRKVLRSHEVRMSGVEEEQKGRLITVFSAPDYCDSTGNLGGVVHFTENEAYDPEKDDGEGYRKVDDDNCPWTLTKETFEASPHPDIKPMAYSKGGFGF
ncbi:Ppt1 serine/threonine phosphatase [Candida orthopsilosis Co 90-125]|uniref:Serine/threonine-protein phosphatase n=1 Tax=Candida orthopsilosis (strain 90-125) TaxID=1136231 RepID=H8X5N5_CANO9|nr:Ppt1 serine/threonine phosphatase [Candida orthopsilosis Co 90-125]CCG23493.1 Ppt1 serine/threonine phosphatase [Candida orthopsilosis Co 90-125]